MPPALMSMPAWPWGELQPRHYRCILTDPPWRFRTYAETGLTKSPQDHYACMDLRAILALPVPMLAHPKGCALVLWATAPMIPEALATIDAWGFRFVTQGAWAKQSRRGTGWAFSTGYWMRSASEFFMIAKAGDIGPLNHITRNLIVAPVREHSRKPDEFRPVIEALIPGPRCELFARERAPGWDAWGNEVEKFTPPQEE
jgi:N6-adenosine-specific RNA methylase IME4